VVDGGDMTSASNRSGIHAPLPSGLHRYPPSASVIVCAGWLVLAIFRSLFLRVIVRLSSDHKHELPCDGSCGWSRRGGIAPRPKEPVSFKRQVVSPRLRLTFRRRAEPTKRCAL